VGRRGPRLKELRTACGIRHPGVSPSHHIKRNVIVAVLVLGFFADVIFLGVGRLSAYKAIIEQIGAAAGRYPPGEGRLADVRASVKS
jgi:hypothetical protein